MPQISDGIREFLVSQKLRGILTASAWRAPPRTLAVALGATCIPAEGKPDRRRESLMDSLMSGGVGRLAAGLSAELSGAVDPVAGGGLRRRGGPLPQAAGRLDLSTDPVIAALRECSSRPAPARPAIARRRKRGPPGARGEGLPRIQPLVNRTPVSLATLVPCLLMRPGSVEPLLARRRGGAAKRSAACAGPWSWKASRCGPARGPFGIPITDDDRVVLQPEDRASLLVADVRAAAPRM